MTTKSTLDDEIELLAPHKRLPRDILSRTDTHQYMSYVKKHYTACVECPYQLECPPCPYTATRRPGHEVRDALRG